MCCVVLFGKCVVLFCVADAFCCFVWQVCCVALAPALSRGAGISCRVACMLLYGICVVQYQQ